MGAAWLGATYGDLKVADGSPVWRRRPEAAGAIGGNEDDALFRGRRCGRRVWARRLERGCGGRVDIAFLLRRAAGGEAKRRCVTGSAATAPSVTVLVRRQQCGGTNDGAGGRRGWLTRANE